MTRVPAALARRDFRALWLAGLSSDAGDWLLFVALPIVVYRLTGSALGTSFAFLVELAPGVLLAPLAGRLADRGDRPRLLVVLSLAQAGSLLPLLAVHTRADLPILYAVIGTQASLAALFNPAKNALLPTLVPGRELVSANALVGLNENLGRLVGGPLGGALLALGSLRLVVAADAASFLLAALLITRLATAPPRRDAPRGAAEPGRGLRAALGARAVRGVLLVTLIASAAQGIFVVLFVLFVAERLHGGAAEIGLLRGIQAGGAIAAGLVLSALARSWSARALTAGAALIFGVVDLVIWNLPWVTTATPAYIVLFVLVGAPGLVMVTGMVSTLQQATAEHERGRVFSAAGLATSAGQAAGMLAAGVLAGPLGIVPLLEAQGVLYVIAAAVAAWRSTAHPRAARSAGDPRSRSPRLASGSLGD